MGILAGVDTLTLPEKLFLKVKKITLQIITILTISFEFATKVCSKLIKLFILFYYRAYRDSWNPASIKIGG